MQKLVAFGKAGPHGDLFEALDEAIEPPETLDPTMMVEMHRAYERVRASAATLQGEAQSLAAAHHRRCWCWLTLRA